MRYESTTGLAGDDIDELAERVKQILDGRGISLGRHLLDLRRQVELVLMLLRHNISQTLAADLIGVSQPTVSRVFRRIKPLLIQALSMTGISLDAAISQGHLLLIDGTYIPTGNRSAAGADTARANYSGKHHCQCVCVQVAATTDGDLVAVSDPVPGSRHDSAALELCGWADAPGRPGCGLDRRYRLHRPRGADTHQEDPRAVPPTVGQGVGRQVSSIRSAVEHAIATLKKWKILSAGYRHRLTELPDTITLTAKLELYRTGW